VPFGGNANRFGSTTSEHRWTQIKDKDVDTGCEPDRPTRVFKNDLLAATAANVFAQGTDFLRTHLSPQYAQPVWGAVTGADLVAVLCVLG
jgi:hypothetical protein